MKKKASVILIIIFVSLLLLGIFKDLLIKASVEGFGSQMLGAPVRLGGFSLGLLNQSIRISNLKIHNPGSFPRGVMVDLPKILLGYDIAALIKGKLHLRDARIHLKEIQLIRNKESGLNVDALKVSAKTQEPKKTRKELYLQIDNLSLNIGRIVYKDYSSGPEPSVQVYEINLEKNYKNITSAQQLVLLILAEPMKQAGIRGASIYGAAALTGAAMLPASVAAALIGKDSAQAHFEQDIERVYDVSLNVLRAKGKIVSADKNSGVIKAEIDSVRVAVKVEKLTAKKTQVTASARKYLLPKPEVANGIIYQITEKLK